MLTKEELIERGYREYNYPNGAPGKGKVVTKLYQKAFRCQNKRLFYLNIWFYDFSRYGERNGWSPEAQFNAHHDQNPTFNVEFLDNDDTTISEIENFFEQIYYYMKCQPYESDAFSSY